MMQRLMSYMQQRPQQQPQQGVDPNIPFDPHDLELHSYEYELPYDDDEQEEGEPITEDEPMAMGYGPIGNRMERMQPQLVHDRPELQRRYPRGIPPDVDETTRMMEGTTDRLRGAELHDRQHRQMKGHARSSKFGLRRQLSDLKATKRAEDRAAISGPGADEQYDEVDLLRRELEDLKRSMGKR